MWMEFIDGNKEVIDVLSKKNEDIKYAYNILKVISKDKKARMEYEARMAAIRDEMTRLHVAEEKGRMEGKKEVAKNLLIAGVDINIIMQSTGLTEEEINKIKSEMNNQVH